ncbi:hypothetical protein As57867_004724, partial [Aphanomyces stellatus]
MLHKLVVSKSYVVRGAPSPTVAARVEALTAWIEYVLGYVVVVLLAVDIFANNWQLIDYIGDGRHFMTPLINSPTVDAVEAKYYFPKQMAPSTVSQVGRYMVKAAVDAVAADGASSFVLALGNFLIQDANNDICGTLARTYPLNNTVTIGSSVVLGVVVDTLTYMRGNAFAQFFGTADPNVAAVGSNHSVLLDMGYLPGRVNTDMRLTTPLVVAAKANATNISAYRFFSKSFCSACSPATELGLDLCSISYTFNDTSKVLTVKSSQAVYGTYHALGFIFDRSWTPMLSICARALSILLVVAIYAVSQRTVVWIDESDLSWWTRLVHFVAPKQYRQPCLAFRVSDVCFNSDVYV